MANPIDETGAVYIQHLNIGGTKYTIKDAWLREEVAAVKTVVAGGVQFKGVSTTAIADGESLKELTVAGSTIAVADQKDGYLFIYNDGTKNLEFIVSNGKYSEFGSTGELGALAFADSASGSVEVPLSSNITFNDYTPNVTKGTLGVATDTETITVSNSEDTASGTFSPASIEVGEKDVDLTPTTSSFKALTSATYDETTGTLTIGEGTSDAFMTGVTGKVAGYTLTQTADQAISVKYQKASEVTATVLKSAALEGDIAVTAAAPTAQINNPTITVTVTPNAD
jgi:hypothetical protein